MKQKIEWYREVLELEPGSRVFFPLAKLLAADGQTPDAVSTLQQGLRKHPDHVEARLLLVELLHLENAEHVLQGEIDGLGELLASYPGFWKAWSERLSSDPAMQDASLAMSFFASAIQGRVLRWSEVIEQGIQAMLRPGDDQGLALSCLSPRSPAGRDPDSAMAPLSADDALPAFSPMKEPYVADDPSVKTRPKLTITLNRVPQAAAPDAAVESDGRQSPAVQEKIIESEPGEEEESEEAFSLRTRSMAEVLAEQGDLAGALDIYTELMQAASPEEKTSLETRAEELALRMNAPVSGEARTDDKTTASGGESTRLVSLLESLAQRLEARAR